MTPEDVAESRLFADLDRLTGAACPRCSRVVCGHEALFSVAMGFKDQAHCLGCLATLLEWRSSELRDHLANHFAHRECFGRVWRVAGEREGVPEGKHPPCLWGNEGPESSGGKIASPVLGEFSEERLPQADEAWDAGDMSCGDLVLALRGRMNRLPSRAVLKVTAYDPAAPEDLPAWCRLTGHRMLRAQHPEYLIQRKEP